MSHEDDVRFQRRHNRGNFDMERKTMKIGITSQNFRTITGHAGRARRFIIFDVSPDGRVSQPEKYDLPKEMCMHEHPRDAAHPIDGLDVLITGSCGDGFSRKLAARGINVVTTGETEPMTAVTALLSGDKLAPAAADDDDHDGCDCTREHKQ
jgi:predicted Fe-Mo cluster-binding NifX family protein